jgi:hypothetical protein
MNDQELTTAVRRSVEGAHMSVPEEQVTSRGRAIRAARRRRVAAGVTAVASAGAAIAAALVLPGAAAPATQQAQDTAYVVSHVTQALDAIPASTIFFMHANNIRESVVTDIWGRGIPNRFEVFRAGRLVSESGVSVGANTRTAVYVDYRNRTWERSTLRVSPLSAAAEARAAGIYTCDNDSESAIPDVATQMAGLLRALVSCGDLKADGTAIIGGVTAVKLTMLTDGETVAWYVNPATYLPIRRTVTRSGTLAMQEDFQWLLPTAANLARLDLPAAPRGFTQVQMPTLP